MSKPDLTILTTHFGTNYSGGSTATCEIFNRLQEEFNSISVVGTEVGEHEFDNLEFLRCTSWSQALGLLRSQAGEQNSRRIFYGDFYNAVLLSFLRQPYYFTYHDNWPELGKLSLHLRLQGLRYWSCYKRVFRTATHVFAVSAHKARQVQRYTDRVSLVRNGVAQLPEKQLMETVSDASMDRQNVLMAGNIDARKYTKALELFRQLPESPGFQVDIYGYDKNPGLTRALCAFPFVKYCGYVNHIPYERYRLLLHTSLMENLSIVWCEAILHGTPVLGFDVGAAREVISQRNGVLVDAYDINQLRQRLLGLVDKKTASADTKLDDDFSWDKAASAYAKVMLSS